MGFGVWEGLQSIGNGCGLQMDGFSAHFDQYESILDNLSDFGNFGLANALIRHAKSMDLACQIHGSDSNIIDLVCPIHGFGMPDAWIQHVKFMNLVYQGMNPAC